MEKVKITFRFIFAHPFGNWPYKSILKNYLHDVKFYAKRGLTGVTGYIYTIYCRDIDFIKGRIGSAPAMSLMGEKN